MELTTDVLSVFDKKWALLTAGDKDSFNTMTVSWGGLGTIWNRPVATVYIRKSRYTHEFVENNDYFTLSFYPEEYRSVLALLGSKSGRDMDKMHDSGLTAKEVERSMTFAEAEMTIVCKKLFSQELKVENMTKEIVDGKFYDGDAVHDMYIAEIVDIIR